ncbi:MAG: type I-C CRISPR-associated protein Cas8c/Csd1 [Verrucomicrobiota bacterium]
MLLKALHDFAHQRNLLDDLAFSPKAVRWIIEMDEVGKFLGITSTHSDDNKRGKEFLCPQTTRAKNGAGVAEFLADGLTAVFGLDPDPEADMPEKTRKSRDANNLAKRANFWRQMRCSVRDLKSPHRLAILRFWKLTRPGSKSPEFLRWGLSATLKTNEKKSGWWLTVAEGSEVKLGPECFTLRVNHELLLESENLKVWWRSCHSSELATLKDQSSMGVCLVTSAENVSLALTHRPRISGVPNTGSFGAPIVSFDKAAFTSYGLEQSLNAPTSDDAARAYAAGLNWMLDRRDHSLRVGASCIVFWAKESIQASSVFARFLDQPQPKAVRTLITSPSKGFLDDEWVRDDEFYVVTLTGNAGRIVVKRWAQQPLDTAVQNLKKWFEDLDLEVPPRPEPKAKKGKPKAAAKEFNPLSIYWLSCATVREAKDLTAETATSLYAAALEGTAPPISLIKPLLDQLQSKILKDENYRVIWDQSRFSLLKLIINRHHRSRNEPTMQLQSKLTTDTPDPAYNCGRLLSVFDNLQRKAHRAEAGGASKLNTTLAERYFGAAASNPNGAFSLMWRLHMHHLKKIRQKGEPGQKTAAAFQRSIMEICRYFKASTTDGSPQFPRVFTLVQQGRFALGYYQQEAERAEQIRLWMERKIAEGKLPPDADEQELDLILDDENQN